MTHEPQQPQFHVGDLVAHEDEPGRFFFVDCVNENKRTDEAGVEYDVFYDVTCATTGDYLIAFPEDLTFTADAASADDFLAAEFAKPSPITKEADPMFAQPPRKPLPAEATARATLQARKTALVDALLDQRQWYAELSAAFGGGYDGSLAQIDEDLSELTRTDTPNLAFMGRAERRIQTRYNHRTYAAPLAGDKEGGL